MLFYGLFKFDSLFLVEYIPFFAHIHNRPFKPFSAFFAQDSVKVAQGSPFPFTTYGLTKAFASLLPRFQNSIGIFCNGNGFGHHI